MYGRAFYTSPYRSGAEEFAIDRTGNKDNVMPVFLNVKNPFIENEVEALGYPPVTSDNEVKKLIDHLATKGLKNPQEIYQRYVNGKVSSIIGELSSAEYDGVERESFKWWHASEIVKEALRELGYDGVIGTYQGEMFIMPQVAAYDPNQIKSADPVTYDDAGRVIPLSERFNQEKDDIRFSVAADDNVAASEGYDEGRMTSDERMAYQMAELARMHQDDLNLKRRALRDIGRQLAELTESMLGRPRKTSLTAAEQRSVDAKVGKAAREQMRFDKQTVDRIVRLARTMMDSGLYKNFSPYEVRRRCKTSLRRQHVSWFRYL
jgi:hypothetical protein